MDIYNGKELISNYQLSNTIKELLQSITDFELTYDKFEPDSEKFFMSYITGSVFLKGPRNLMLLITLSKHPAALMVSKISGIEYEQITPEDIHDGVMEVANMIAGKIKSKAALDNINLELSSPVAVIGKSHITMVKDKTEVVAFRLRDKDFQILVKLIYI